jgi:hypothetical protein
MTYKVTVGHIDDFAVAVELVKLVSSNLLLGDGDRDDAYIDAVRALDRSHGILDV